MKKAQRIITLIFGTAILFGTVWFFGMRGSYASQPQEERVYPVKTIQTKSEKWGSQGMYGGFVKGKNQVMLSPKISGRITAIAVKDGDVVKKGDVIAVLSADELTQQVAGTQELIASLDDTLEKTEEYYDQKIDEAKDDDASKESIRSAKKLRDLQMQTVHNSIVESHGALRVAQSLAKETVVRAPFDGVVTRVYQEVGQMIDPTVSICEIVDQSVLEVEVFISQKTAQDLSLNDRVILRDEEGVDSDGVVRSLGVRTKNNAQKIRVTVDVVDPTIEKIGQYVSIILPRASSDVEMIAIPESAVIHKYDDTFVFVVENDRAIQRRVTLGETFDGMIVIMDGLRVDEVVITEGVHMLKENNLVQIYE